MRSEKNWRNGWAYQMFELCWQAAIVGFLHVHHLRVGAKDVELSWTEEKETEDSIM